MSLDTCILKTVKEKQPKTVEQLIQLVQKELSVSKEEIMKKIIDLNNEGKLNFEDYSLPSTPKGSSFLIKTLWYWVTIALALATTVVISFPETVYPLAYVRYLFGSIFVLFLPGFTLIKVFFPAKKFGIILRAALSVGMSLAIVPLIGLIVNYTEEGITTNSVTVSLLVATLIFATLGVILENKKAKQTEE